MTIFDSIEFGVIPGIVYTVPAGKYLKIDAFIALYNSIGSNSDNIFLQVVNGSDTSRIRELKTTDFGNDTEPAAELLGGLTIPPGAIIQYIGNSSANNGQVHVSMSGVLN